MIFEAQFDLLLVFRARMDQTWCPAHDADHTSEDEFVEQMKEALQMPAVFNAPSMPGRNRIDTLSAGLALRMPAAARSGPSVPTSQRFCWSSNYRRPLLFG